MDGLTETVRVMVDASRLQESGTTGDASIDEMGEPVKAWSPVDVPGCLVRVVYKDAEADAVEPMRPDAAELTVYVAMDSSLIDFALLRGARLRFPDRFTGDAVAQNELHVIGMPWPTPQSPLQWDIMVEAAAQHG